MADLFKNYIAGEWVAGSGEIENTNPSDLDDLIGLYAQASSAQLDDALAQAAKAQSDMAAIPRICSAATAVVLRAFAFAESSAINWLARAIGLVR